MSVLGAVAGRGMTVGSALLASAGGDRVSILLGLEPAWPAAHALGPALTVQGAAGDNLALHHAVSTAEPGEVIVLAVGGETGTAHCGDIVALAARERGVAGIVVDGAIRDRARTRVGRRPGLPPRHVAARPRQGRPRRAARDGRARRRHRPPGRPRLRRRGRHRDRARPPTPTPCSTAARAIEEREREIVAALERGETTVAIFGLKELP